MSVLNRFSDLRASPRDGPINLPRNGASTSSGTVVMDRKPVDVMVVNFNTASLLQPMFDALRQADSEKLASYLVVDNASVDDSVERMAKVCPEALLLSNKKNVGFGRANNQLPKAASREPACRSPVGDGAKRPR